MSEYLVIDSIHWNLEKNADGPQIWALKKSEGSCSKFLLFKLELKFADYLEENSNQTCIWSLLILLHIIKIHLRYHSCPKSEKLAKKKWVEEENLGRGNEISTNLSQNSPIIWRKTLTDMSLTNTNASTHHKDSFEVPFMHKNGEFSHEKVSRRRKSRSWKNSRRKR